MKNLIYLAIAIGMSSCVPQKHESTEWTMSWRCNTQYCYSHISPNSWGGNGSFASESDCVAWEAYFLNSAGANNGGQVSACTGN